MPTISVGKDTLFEAVGKTFTTEELDELCFQFGIELDDTVVAEDGSVEYKVDIPANRYDLLCVEGLSRGLRVFLGLCPPPRYVARLPPFPQLLVIKPATGAVRPHAVAAVLRGVSLTAEAYRSLIDLQDKLHHNICRQRSLVAIGTHDLDTIQGPFTYDALPPEDIKFRPLGHGTEVTAPQMMEMYSKESHLKAYLPIIRDKPVYPLITDANGVVLSMPPIINGEHSKIQLSTRNILIECTATDLTKAKIVLDTLVTMFSQYCDEPFSVEAALVQRPDATKLTYPCLPYRTEEVNIDRINRAIGISEEGQRLAELLSKMCLTSHVSPNGSSLLVEIPPTRADILHACDIIEDVAIGHGYNNIEQKLPSFMTIATQQPVNKLSDQLRGEVAAAGFTEVLTFALCSRADVSTKLRRNIEDTKAVHIANPKTLEFQVGRTTLLPGILKTAAASRSQPLPLKLFEIQDVLMVEQAKDTGAKNSRRVCAVYVGNTPGFEQLHGLLDRIMQVLEVKHCPEGKEGYCLRQAEDPTYLEGRCGEVVVKGQRLGMLGVLHPEVVLAFDLPLPAAALEIDLEPFV